jgi:hypothetical protein
MTNMVNYSLKEVTARIMKMEMGMFQELVRKIDVGEVFVSDQLFKACVTLHLLDGTTLVMADRVYPKNFFEDCITSKTFDMSPFSIRTEKLMENLRNAEQNEEGVELSNIKRHIGHVKARYDWLVSSVAGDKAYREPSYYATQLTASLDDAEKYIDFISGVVYMAGCG